MSWQHGEKAGISQFVNGISNVVVGEKTDAYEIGLKTVLLNDTLVFNTAVFYSEIENYQQQVRIVDEYTTALNIANGVTPATAYTSATGNVPRVTVKGVEIDGVYAGIPNTTIRFSGAYNDAYYRGLSESRSASRKRLPGCVAVSRCQRRKSAGLVQVPVQSRRGLARAGIRPARVPHQRQRCVAGQVQQRRGAVFVCVDSRPRHRRSRRWASAHGRAAST